MGDSFRVGSYRLLARLGQGGTADVFLARKEGPKGVGFAKLAVIKRLRPHLAEDADFISMLMDEGRLTARLSHPNIVQVLGVGQDGDDCYLAMEHLDGQPLHHIERRATKTGTPIPRELNYAVICDVLAALHHAHEMKDFSGQPLEIVHRDVTPHNIFVTYDGNVKLVDFGIAKAIGRLTETRHGIVKGKVRYMSPEQASGGTVDRRTDIFATGVLLFKAAAGSRLWGDRDEFEVPQALVRGEYDPSPRVVNPTVPEEIDAICRKALAFKPQDRYATAAEMQADLERFVGPRSPTHADLAKLLQTMFAKDRQKLRAVLENAGKPSIAPPAALVSPVPTADRTKQMTVVMASSMPRIPSSNTPSLPPTSVSLEKSPDANAKQARSRPNTRRAPATTGDASKKKPRSRSPSRSRTLGRGARDQFRWGSPAMLGVLVAAIVVTFFAGITTTLRPRASSGGAARTPNEAANEQLALSSVAPSAKAARSASVASGEPSSSATVPSAAPSARRGATSARGRPY